MKRISDIDSNFRVNTELKKDGLSFYDIEKDPFSVYGILRKTANTDASRRKLPKVLVREFIIFIRIQPEVEYALGQTAEE